MARQLPEETAENTGGWTSPQFDFEYTGTTNKSTQPDWVIAEKTGKPVYTGSYVNDPRPAPAPSMGEHSGSRINEAPDAQPSNVVYGPDGKRIGTRDKWGAVSLDTPSTPKAGKDYFTVPDELKWMGQGAGMALEGFGNVARGAINAVGGVVQGVFKNPLGLKDPSKVSITRLEGGGNPLNWYSKSGVPTAGQLLSDLGAVGMAVGAPEAAVIKAGTQIARAAKVGKASRGLAKIDDVVAKMQMTPSKTIGSGKSGVVTEVSRLPRAEGPGRPLQFGGTVAAGKGVAEGTGSGKGSPSGKGSGPNRGPEGSTGGGSQTLGPGGRGRSSGPEGKPMPQGGGGGTEVIDEAIPEIRLGSDPKKVLSPQLSPVASAAFGFPKSSGTDGGEPLTLPDTKTSTKTRPSYFPEPEPQFVPKKPKGKKTKAGTKSEGGRGGRPRDEYEPTDIRYTGSEEQIRKEF